MTCQLDVQLPLPAKVRPALAPEGIKKDIYIQCALQVQGHFALHLP